jgi:hypothetical protein
MTASSSSRSSNASRKRPRKQVHFQLDDGSLDIHRTVIEVPSVLDIVECRGDLWMQPEDIQVLIVEMQQDMAQMRLLLCEEYKSYTAALAETYLYCCANPTIFATDNNDKEDGTDVRSTTVPSSSFSSPVPVKRHVELLSYGMGIGLEPSVLPELALERRRSRKNGIRGVVELDRVLRKAVAAETMTEDANLVLSTFASALSQPARLFARALGAADALASLRESISFFTAATGSAKMSASSCDENRRTTTVVAVPTPAPAS